MRRGFVESKCQKATTPFSSASSNTVSGLAGRAGRPLKSTECNAALHGKRSPSPRRVSLISIEAASHVAALSGSLLAALRRTGSAHGVGLSLLPSG